MQVELTGRERADGSCALAEILPNTIAEVAATSAIVQARNPMGEPGIAIRLPSGPLIQA